MRARFTIAPATRPMLDRLHALDQAAAPGVPETPRAIFDLRFREADITLAALDQHGAPMGFVLLLGRDAAQAGPNHAWFMARSDALSVAIGYVDRIAVDPALRGLGAGEALYRAVIEACAGRFQRIGCEVNLSPPNPGSLRFHQRLGFAEVGRRVFAPGEKAVIYLERAVAG